MSGGVSNLSGSRKFHCCCCFLGIAGTVDEDEDEDRRDVNILKIDGVYSTRREDGVGKEEVR